MLKQSSKRIKGKLTELLATVGDMALKRRAGRIIEELELKKGEKILEVGCGNGYYLNLLNRLNLELELIGVDNDPQALRDAKKYISDEKVKLILDNAQNLPLRSNNFDKIILSEVIEHVEDEQKILSEIYRVLKPEGVLVLTTCNVDYPFLWDPINWILQHFFKIHIRAGFWAGIWNQHIRLYKKDYLNKIVKRANFKIEISQYLTRWCLPFNHYLVNLVARLFYQGILPESISKGLNKFDKEQGYFPIRVIFWLVNTYDKLNDFLPGKNGVSIFVKARK